MKLIAALIVLYIVLSAGFSSAQTAMSGKTNASGTQSISVRGSDTILPLAQAEAEKFMQLNAGKSITVRGGGTGVGIAALIGKQVDIADASREMTSQ